MRCVVLEGMRRASCRDAPPRHSLMSSPAAALPLRAPAPVHHVRCHSEYALAAPPGASALRSLSMELEVRGPLSHHRPSRAPLDLRAASRGIRRHVCRLPRCPQGPKRSSPPRSCFSSLPSPPQALTVVALRPQDKGGDATSSSVLLVGVGSGGSEELPGGRGPRGVPTAAAAAPTTSSSEDSGRRGGVDAREVEAALQRIVPDLQSQVLAPLLAGAAAGALTGGGSVNALAVG
jgi:hypothetical protein